MSLETIRNKYGVPAFKGVKVEFEEKGIKVNGVIVGSSRGSYLLVLIEGRRRSVHPSYNIRYFELL